MQTKTQNSVDSILVAVAGTPEFYLTKVTQIGSNFARIVGNVRASANPQQVLAAARNLHKNFVPVQGSFTAIASNGITSTYEGIIASLPERIVLDESNEGSYRAIASTNMYMDEEEKLWSMVKTDAGKILISSHASDEGEVMANLMKSVASAQPEQDVQYNMSVADASRQSVQGGDLVSFVNNEGGVQMGFVVAAVANADGSDAGLSVVTQLNEDIHHIDRNMVVAFVNGNEVEGDEEAQLEAVAAGNINFDMIANYYRRVFARRPAYFEAFMERFRNHAFA